MAASGIRLAGKVAIVTGGGSGFGEGISKRFADEGCKVVVADLDPVGGQRVAGYHLENMIFVEMNVAKETGWTECLNKTVEKFGKVDILVNNAGTSYKNKSSKHFIPRLISQGTGGSIINIASIGATRPRPGLVWYNASKAAVANATKGLASEYGDKNVRVNSVCPLLCNTGLFETFVGVPYTEENMKKFLFNVPLGRLTEPKDVANYCLYLASDEGSFITGTCLEVDGGRGI